MEEGTQNVKVTLHLSPEAARILHQYAGERNRGYFVSQLLLAQRQQDEKVAQRTQKALAAAKKKKAHR